MIALTLGVQWSVTLTLVWLHTSWPVARSSQVWLFVLRCRWTINTLWLWSNILSEVDSHNVHIEERHGSWCWCAMKRDLSHWRGSTRTHLSATDTCEQWWGCKWCSIAICHMDTSHDISHEVSVNMMSNSSQYWWSTSSSTYLQLLINKSSTTSKHYLFPTNILQYIATQAREVIMVWDRFIYGDKCCEWFFRMGNHIYDILHLTSNEITWH